MSAYVITYDLKQSGSRSYESLYEAIKSYKTWAHITESCWAIVTDQKCAEVRDFLGKELAEGDRLFVVKSANVASWRNVICKNQWLKDNI